jgi:integrase
MRTKKLPQSYKDYGIDRCAKLQLYDDHRSLNRNSVMSNNIKTFSDRYLKSLKGRHSSYDVREGTGGGFAVRVMPSGTVSFQFLYRLDGKARRMNISRYPAKSLAEARVLHREAYGATLAGRDPANERKEEKAERLAEQQAIAQAKSVKQLIESFLKLYAYPKLRGAKEVDRLLRKEIISTVGDVPADELDRRTLASVLDEIVARGAPVTANRTLAAIRKTYNWAVARGLVDFSPVSGLPAPGAEGRRDRVLSPEELEVLWVALPDTVVGDTVRFLLASVQRKSEVLGMVWDELNLDSGWWTIPSSRTKNKLEHRVPISETMSRLINHQDGRKGNKASGGAIFPSPRSGKPLGSQTPNHLISRLRAEGKLEDVEHFTLHDCRRTAATSLGDAGFGDAEIGLLLNHKRVGVTARYNKSKYD